MKTILFDCSNLAYMAFHTTGGLSHEEKRTGTMFGFLHQIFRLAQLYGSRHLVFCWDSRKSYRKQSCSTYKNPENKKELTREEKREIEAFYSQMTELRKKVVFTLGFGNSYICTGFEADDIIASLAIGNPGAIVVSSDNDLWQLLDYCTIYNPRTRGEFTKKDFVDLWGVKPKDWAKVKAIAGCSSDNVLGIDGAANIKAVRYLRGELSEGKVKDRIKSKQGKQLIEKNTALVKLPYMDLDLSLENPGKTVLDFDEDFSVDAWGNLFEEYGFRSFLKKEYFNKLRRNFGLI